MACRTCGKNPISATRNVKPMDTSSFVEMKFTGTGVNQRRIASRSDRRISYMYSEQRPYIKVNPQDVEYMKTRGFIVESPPVIKPTSTPALKVDTPKNVTVEKALLTELDLDPKTTSRLLEEFLYVEDVDRASDSDIVSIKHIGEGRLQEIRDAIEKWKSLS